MPKKKVTLKLPPDVVRQYPVTIEGRTLYPAIVIFEPAEGGKPDQIYFDLRSGDATALGPDFVQLQRWPAKLLAIVMREALKEN